jgi:hypothetical protein
MPKTLCAAVDLAPLLEGSSAGERIPELARHGLQQLIKLELAAFRCWQSDKKGQNPALPLQQPHPQ